MRNPIRTAVLAGIVTAVAFVLASAGDARANVLVPASQPPASPSLLFTPDLANPAIPCDSELKPLKLGVQRVGTVSGALPGETITFTQVLPKDVAYVPGSADANGKRDFWFSCFRGEGGKTITVTARGNITGRTVTFTFSTVEPPVVPPAVVRDPPIIVNDPPSPPQPVPPLDPNTDPPEFGNGNPNPAQPQPVPPLDPNNDLPEFGNGNPNRPDANTDPPEFGNGNPNPTKPSLEFIANQNFEAGILCDGFYEYPVGGLIGALPGEELELDIDPRFGVTVRTDPADEDGTADIWVMCDPEVGSQVITIRARGKTSGRDVEIDVNAFKSLGFRADPLNADLAKPIPCDNKLQYLGEIYYAQPGETLLVTIFRAGRAPEEFSLKANADGAVEFGYRCLGPSEQVTIVVRGLNSGRELEIWFDVVDTTQPRTVEAQLPGVLVPWR
jgi:hypothetical protein